MPETKDDQEVEEDLTLFAEIIFDKFLAEVKKQKNSE